MAASSTEDNKLRLFALTMVAGLALPINLVAGPMDTHVGGVPLSGKPHGFCFTLAMIATVTPAIPRLRSSRR
jgi:zinc transporter